MQNSNCMSVCVGTLRKYLLGGMLKKFFLVGMKSAILGMMRFSKNMSNQSDETKTLMVEFMNARKIYMANLSDDSDELLNEYLAVGHKLLASMRNDAKLKGYE
jgi:hypothetical protein